MIRVVAAVIVARPSDSPAQVLACRRTKPPALAGRWEFPGGKVEPGETDEQALHRELREELAIEVDLHGRLGGELPMIGGPGVWQPYVATIVSGRPTLLDHDALRWLAAAQLHDLEWLSSDVPVLAAVADLLANGDRSTAHPGGVGQVRRG